MDKEDYRSETYSVIVKLWTQEREMLGAVQPYTASKAGQKALLLAPYIDVPIEEIDAASIRHAIIELRQHGGRANRGLSSATLRAAHLAGKQAIDWAIAQGVSISNPFCDVKRPKANYRQARFLTLGQATMISSQLIVAMKEYMNEGEVQLASFALAACIALATGMRRGEIFALEWSACNFKTMRINVSQAVKADGSVGAPKSISGVRSIAIGVRLSTLMNEMRDWRERILPTCNGDDNKPVICKETGYRANLDIFEHWWRSWADDNGWEGLRFHDLRHTHATLLISGGTDVKTVQMRLGHSSADITMNCYAHAIPLSDTSAAASIDSSLFG